MTKEKNKKKGSNEKRNKCAVRRQGTYWKMPFALKRQVAGDNI